VGAPSAAAARLYGEWRGYRKSCCCGEQRRFRKDQETLRDSVARRSTFGNWRLLAEQGFKLITARSELQDRDSEHEHALEFHPNTPPDYREKRIKGYRKVKSPCSKKFSGCAVDSGAGSKCKWVKKAHYKKAGQ
jgi:hypothetical protein